MYSELMEEGSDSHNVLWYDIMCIFAKMCSFKIFELLNNLAINATGVQWKM